MKAITKWGNIKDNKGIVKTIAKGRVQMKTISKGGIENDNKRSNATDNKLGNVNDNKLG